MATKNTGLNDETNAILDRLKKEGDLLRNRGAHSVKSVKIELGKFEAVFDTIALNVTEQTEMMRETLGIQQDAARAQARAAELDELKTRNASKFETVSEGPRGEKGVGVLSVLGTALNGVMGTLGKLAIGGAIGIAGAAVLWQIAKGFIDEKMGKGAADEWLDDTITSIKDFKNNVIARAPQVISDSLDTMEQGVEDAKGYLTTFGETIDDAKKTYEEQKEAILGENGVLARVTTSIDETIASADGIMTTATGVVNTARTSIDEASATLSQITGTFENVNFESLKSTFTRLSNELPPAANKILDFFANPLTHILPPLAAGLVAGGVANVTGRAIAGLVLPKGAGVGPGGSISPVANLRTAAIGAVAIGIGIFGDKVKNWLTSEDGLGDVDIAGVNVGSFLSGAVDVVGMAAQGATLGAMFGPQGALVGAIIGGVVGLGMKLYDWFTNKEAAEEAEMAKRVAEAEAEYQRRKEEYDRRAAELATMTPEQQEAALEGMTQAEVDAVGKGIDANPALAFQEEQNRLVREYENLRLGGDMTAVAAQSKLNQIRALERDAAAEGVTIVNYAPTNIDGGTQVGGSTVVKQATSVGVGTGGGTGVPSGSPFPGAVN